MHARRAVARESSSEEQQTPQTHEVAVDSVPPSASAERAVPAFARFSEGIVDSIAEALLIEDAQGTIELVNAALESMLGYTTDELIGRPWEMIVPSGEIRIVRQKTAQRPSGFSDQYETQLQAKNGSTVPVLVHARPLFENGAYIGVLSAFTDITELKSAQDRVRRSEELAVRSHRLLLALSRAAEAVGRARSPDEVYETMGEEMAKLGYDALLLHLTDDGQHLTVRYHTLDPRRVCMAEKLAGNLVEGYSFVVEEGGVLARAMKNAQTTYHSPASELIAEVMPHKLRALAGRLAAKMSIDQAICAPLMVDGKAQGLLILSGVGLGEADVPGVTVLANQAASALHHTRLNQATQESEERFRAISTFAHDAIIMIDAPGRVVYWNQAATRMFGYPGAEALGKQLCHLIAPRDDPQQCAAVLENLQASARHNAAGTMFEFLAAKKDGTSIPLEVSIAAMALQGQQHTVWIARDVTDVRERERAAQIREAVYKISEAVHDAQNLPQLYAAIHETVGELMPAENLYIALHDQNSSRLSFAYFADQRDEPPAPRTLGRGITEYVLRSGEPLLASSATLRDLASKGEIELVGSVPEMWLGVPLRKRDQIIGVLAVQSYDQGTGYSPEQRDILSYVSHQVAMAIERKQAEQQLRQYAARLEQANEEVKQFAYIVSHDLRAPLVNLRGFASELRDAVATFDGARDTILNHLDDGRRAAIATALDEDIPEALGFIDSSVARLDHLVGALLRLSRLGRRELSPEPVDVGAVVQAALQAFAHHVEEVRAEVVVGQLPAVIADRSAMEQIVGNLLDNAIKYLDPSRRGRIRVTAEQKDHEIIFHVRDNGRGISGDDFPKVLAPFRRAGPQDVPGDGMGLPYVQTLVNRQGGRLWFESELGTGSEFSFSLPDLPA